MRNRKFEWTWTLLYEDYWDKLPYHEDHGWEIFSIHKFMRPGKWPWSAPVQDGWMAWLRKPRKEKKSDILD